MFWPLILIDLYTEEGVIGRSYLEPYIPKSMRYLIPVPHDLGEMLKGRRLVSIEFMKRLSIEFMKRPARRCTLLVTRAWR
jgi:mandelate racemase